jgi:enamine deaminase RidA (YjgF/YER057c/UK114 family)
MARMVAGECNAVGTVGQLPLLGAEIVVLSKDAVARARNALQHLDGLIERLSPR